MLLLFLALPVNLFAIALLAGAIYFRRHHRTDLMVALIAVNVGVFTVSALMVAQRVELAVAFGLFGVLSILRLRSEQLNQREVGYYFIALALGLTNGVGSSMPVVMVCLDALLLVTMLVADHPRVGRGVQRRTLVLDRIFPDAVSLRAALAERVHGDVLRSEVTLVDHVRETMEVDVRFREWPPGRGVQGAAEAAPAGAEATRPLGPVR